MVDPASLDANTPYLGLEHIERGGRILGHGTIGGSAVASTKVRFSPEHVLFGKLRPNLAKVSLPTFSGVCSTDILPIRPGSELDRGYLAHFLLQPSVVAFAASRTSGANLPRLSPNVLASFRIPLPSIGEQRRIVSLLDAVDTLRQKRRAELTALDTLSTSIFKSSFDGRGDPVLRLSDVAESWDCAHSTPAWTESGSICLRTSNLTVGGWDWSDTRYVDAAQFEARSKGGGALPGDIILSREGTVGIAAIVEPGMHVCLGQRLVQVRARDSLVKPEYLLAVLLSALRPSHIASTMVGSAAQHLNVSDLRALAIPLAPLDEQQRFAARIAALSVQRAAADRALGVHEELFESVLSQSFRKV